jgi:D-alanine transaminase
LAGHTRRGCAAHASISTRQHTCDGICQCGFLYIVAREAGYWCDLKTVNLLPNVLAKQKAVAAGVHEALLMRDGVIMEGAATNFFGVIDGMVRTHPKTNNILPGITREVVLELAAELGIAVREEPMLVDDIPRLTESFLTGTTNDVMPVVAIDGRPVGDGRPGPIAGRLYSALMNRWRVGD